jgi:hypothetical protein
MNRIAANLKHIRDIFKELGYISIGHSHGHIIAYTGTNVPLQGAQNVLL